MDVMEVPDTVPVLIGQLPLQRPSPSALWPVSDRATRPTEGLPYRGRPSVGQLRQGQGQLRQGQTRDLGFQRKARSIEATFLARSGFLSVARLPR
jgi:hypothetical protein